MQLQEAVARTRVFVPFVISMDVLVPSRQWLVDESERKFQMLVNSLQSLIFLWKCQVELDEPDPGLRCYGDEMVYNDELIQGLFVGDTNDFDSVYVYTYKTSFCLFEIEVVGMEAWGLLILEREKVWFDGRSVVNFHS
jgi:hypothetical protein